MTEPMTPGQQRTAKAIAARKRGSQERLANRLRDTGWTVIPPEYTITDETRTEWGVIWPNGDDEVMPSDLGEDPETMARSYAAQFSPRPRVARQIVRVITATGAWEDQPSATK